MHSIRDLEECVYEGIPFIRGAPHRAAKDDDVQATNLLQHRAEPDEPGGAFRGESQALAARDNDMGNLDWLDWLDAWARALPEPPAAGC